MVSNKRTGKQIAYSDVTGSLPLPKLTPKTLHRYISRDIPTLVRKGQEHVLAEPGLVAFMGLSQITDTFDVKLSTAARWYYFRKKGYPLVITYEVAFELASIIRQTEKEEGGFGDLLKKVGVSNDLVPEELELELRANAELEKIVFDAWEKVGGTLSNRQYSQSTRILRTDIRVVASAMARAGKGLETYVITTAPEIESLVGMLEQHYPIHLLGSGVPIHEYYEPALRETAVLFSEEFVAALPSAEPGSYGIFKEAQVIPGLAIKKPVGFQVSTDPKASTDKARIRVPIVNEDQAFESFPLLNSSRFLVYKPVGRIPPRVVGSSVMRLNSKGELVDTSGHYKNVSFGSYLKDSGISNSPSIRETVHHHLATRGIVVPRPLSYSVIDAAQAAIASNL
jgi:hypothetical protein